MITWIVILSIIVLLMMACMAGQHFRINQQDEAIARLSLQLLDMKLAEAEAKGDG